MAKNKYKNKQAEVDGIVFSSIKEAKRYGELLMMIKAGEITNLELQKEYVLIPPQYVNVRTSDGKVKKRCAERAVKYVADFVYQQDGKTVVEDVKGYRNPSSAGYAKFVLKRKMMLYFHNIVVREV